MEQQVKTLSARGVSGPAATALSLTPNVTPGPRVDIVGTLADGEDDFVPGEDDVSDASDGNMDDEEYEEEYEYEEGSEEELSEMSDGE